MRYRCGSGSEKGWYKGEKGEGGMEGNLTNGKALRTENNKK